MKQTHFKVFYELIAGNLIIVAIIFVVAGVVSYRSLNAQYLSEVEAYQHQLTGVAEQYIEHLWPLPDAEMEKVCRQFVVAPAHAPVGGAPAPSAGLPIRLTVIAEDGRVLGDSEHDPARMQNHKTPDRPEVLEALEGRLGQDTRRSETVAVQYRYIAMSIIHDGKAVGVVRTAMPVLAIARAQNVIRDTILWTMVMAVVAFVLVGLLVNWVWYALLKQRSAAQPMASPPETKRPDL